MAGRVYTVKALGPTGPVRVGKMRNGYAKRNTRESFRFLEKLRATNKRMSGILDRLPSMSREEASELSGLAKIQGELMQQTPPFSSAEERFRIDTEKLQGMHLLQRAIKFLRDKGLKNRGAQ